MASISTAETAARESGKAAERLLSLPARAPSRKAERTRSGSTFCRAGADAAATDKLAGVLVEQGIEVKRATRAVRAGGRTYAAGDYVISLAQPAKRLIRTLLDPQVALDELS